MSDPIVQQHKVAFKHTSLLDAFDCMLCLAGSANSSNSPPGASPNSPGSPGVMYSPSAAAAAAAAAAVLGHHTYNMSQSTVVNHSQYPGYQYQPSSMLGWQQGFVQGAGYGQPMRA